MPTTLLHATPDFQTFLRPCQSSVGSAIAQNSTEQHRTAEKSDHLPVSTMTDPPLVTLALWNTPSTMQRKVIYIRQANMAGL
jgi:hypothetical protein